MKYYNDATMSTVSRHVFSTPAEDQDKRFKETRYNPVSASHESELANFEPGLLEREESESIHCEKEAGRRKDGEEARMEVV